MNNEAFDLERQSNQESNQDQELSEDMEVISPGQMLAQARQSLKLSKQDIADKLNFRLALVTSIEQDNYDNSLPETFNRGYLRSYAKLVNINESDILTSYETLNIAKIQCAEMQSFSHFTEKQAQNSRLMWVSYLIITLLIASTIIWWLQNEKATNSEVKTIVTTSISQKPKTEIKPEILKESPVEIPEQVIDKPSLDVGLLPDINAEPNLESNPEPQSKPSTEKETTTSPIAEEQPILPATAIFTFAGDCWVNIFDATGERIAWGVKKPGYVMTITGVAPFKVTVGRPELASISFNDQKIDMSQFNVGNIAKFTLPIKVN